MRSKGLGEHKGVYVLSGHQHVEPSAGSGATAALALSMVARATTRCLALLQEFNLPVTREDDPNLADLGPPSEAIVGGGEVRQV